MATAVVGVARGGSRVVGAEGVGGAQAQQGRGLSSYLADAVRENAANHCIERVSNGSMDASVIVVSYPYWANAKFLLQVGCAYITLLVGT